MRSLILNSHDPHSMLWWPESQSGIDRHDPANLHPVRVLAKSRLVYFLQGRIISSIWSGSFQWVFSRQLQPRANLEKVILSCSVAFCS
eukprot:s2087_g10.t1